MTSSVRLFKSRQRGVTMLVVMVLLSVMLLGALALARITDVSSIASGNAVYREASLQASEIGVNAAFAAVNGVANIDVAVGNWYSPQILAQDATTGLPAVNWATVPALPPVGAGGAYSVQYVVERMCTVAVVTDPQQQCLIKQNAATGAAGVNTAKLPDEKLEAPSATQYRVTVRVTGPKDTTTFVQSLLTRS